MQTHTPTPKQTAAFYLAIQQNDVAIARAMLMQGFPPDTTLGHSDHVLTNGLCYAAFDGMADMCDLLIEFKCNVQASRLGQSALACAITALPYRPDAARIVHSLLAAGAGANELSAVLSTESSLRTRRREGTDELWHPSEEQMLDLAKRLVNKGASPSYEHPVAKLTPFQDAVRLALIKHVDYFVRECGEDPQQTTASGRSMNDLARASPEMRDCLRALRVERDIAESITSGTAAAAVSRSRPAPCPL
jgi:hypothetical protein